MGGSQYSKLKLGAGDKRVRKKGLLFLVGEVRRDVIPRLLGDGGGERGRRIEVEEAEVYSTVIRDDFEGSFRKRIEELNREGHETIVVVVFSPGGCEAMLRVIGWVDGDGDDGDGDMTKTRTKRSGLKQFVVAAIGPTTRDYLKGNFGFEVDVTARKPSPEGVSEGVEAFLRGRGVLS
jgi:uroporphyrinogen-III synthase